MSAALDELIAGVDMKPRRKVITLPSGDDFVFFASPVTLEQRERARADSKKEDATTFALTLLVAKAEESNGRKRFNLGDLPGLKRLIPASLAETILERLLDDAEDDLEDSLTVSHEEVSAATPKTSRRPSLATAS